MKEQHKRIRAARCGSVKHSKEPFEPILWISTQVRRQNTPSAVQPLAADGWQQVGEQQLVKTRRGR